MNASRSLVWLPALRLTVALVLIVLGGAPLRAHELQPAYLELRQLDATTWRVLWKTPARADVADAFRPRLPDGVRRVGEPVRMRSGDSQLERSTIEAPPGGLDGGVVTVEGPGAAIADVLVRVVRTAGEPQVFRLTPTSPAQAIEPGPSRLRQAFTYLRMGAEHILMGVDHLLFVAGLLFIVRGRAMLVKTITAFTVAHSLTLAAATLGWASVPVPPLHAVIALSILFLGPEMVRARRGETSLTLRHPWLVAFAFGLLHGFGFASGLTTLGLSGGEIPLALLLFNVGVELGQLFFVAVLLGLGRAFGALEIVWPRWALAAPACVVGGLGAYWTIARVRDLFVLLS